MPKTIFIVACFEKQHSCDDVILQPVVLKISCQMIHLPRTTKWFSSYGQKTEKAKKWQALVVALYELSNLEVGSVMPISVLLYS